MSLFRKFRDNFKIAWKSVRSSRKEYAVFFAALLLVQLLLGVATLVHGANARIEEKTVSSRYDYHLEVRGLTEEQFYLLRNAHTGEQEKDWLFEPEFSYVEYEGESGAKRYDAHLRLRGNPIKSAAAFRSTYESALAGAAIGETPLLALSREAGGGRAGFALLLLLLAALSFLLLTVLYRIKLKHYKFTYGIYLSFGADFPRLLTTALFEMGVIAALTALPATLLTYVVGLALYLSAGSFPGFSLLPVPVLLGGSLLCALLSVILPLLALSRTTPVKLLASENNAGLVVSPRRSSRLIEAHSVLPVEALSLFRFRRHLAGLLLSGTLFGAFFVAGAYFSRAKKTVDFSPTPRYTLDFSASAIRAEDVLGDLQALDGVLAVTRQNEALGGSVLLPSSALRAGSGFKDYPKKKGYKGSALVQFSPADEDTLSVWRDFCGYRLRGDPSRLLEYPEDSVILSDAVGGRSVTDIQPGEKIYVEVERHIVGFLKTQGEAFGFSRDLEGNDLLPSLYESADFTFRAFTVAAVIENAPADENLSLFFAPDTFADLAGTDSAGSPGAMVYLDPSLSEGALTALDGQMGALANSHPGVLLTTSDDAGARQIAARQNGSGAIALLAAALFLVFPMILFFSQSLFYSGRALEFDIYRAVGAIPREVRALHLLDGAVLALLAGGLFSLLSWGAVHLCSYLLGRGWVQTLLFGAPGSFRFFPTIPLAPFLIGLALTLAVTFLASLLPYLSYRKKIAAQLSLDLTDVSL